VMPGGFRTVKRVDIIGRLQKKGWTVVKRSAEPFRLPPDVAVRHPNLPAAVTKFLGGLLSCENDTKTAWFLCEADYAGTSGAAFRWDEWERMSLEAAADDSRFAAAARAFWGRAFAIPTIGS